MTDLTNDPLADVSNADGKIRVCAGKCTTCLFQPGRMVREVVDDARERGSFVVCHETYENTGFVPAPGVERAMCRGYLDAYGARQPGLDMLLDAEFFVDVPTPPEPEDKRHHVLLDRDTDGEFQFRRVDKDAPPVNYTVWQGPPGQVAADYTGSYDDEVVVIQDPAWEVLGEAVAGGAGDSPWIIEVEVQIGDDKCRVRATLQYLDENGNPR